MKTYIKKLFKQTNKKLHRTLLEWLDDSDYRAQLFVEDYIEQLINELKKKDLTQADFAAKADVSRPAITQLLGADENISIKRIFNYANVLGLTLEHPKLVEKDFQNFYKEYIEAELGNDFEEIVDVEKKGDFNLDSINSAGEEGHESFTHSFSYKEALAV